MKNNNKGFFLAETIVVIALVTTVMAFVYPNVSKLYENYKNKALYYDQPEDLYVLKAYSEILKTEIEKVTKDTTGVIGCKTFTNKEEITVTTKFGNIEKLYITGYMTEVSDNDYNFNKYLKRLKKTTYDSASYRLIGVFKVDDKARYASIKIDNPNPNRNCNLGG